MWIRAGIGALVVVIVMIAVGLSRVTAPEPPGDRNNVTPSAVEVPGSSATPVDVPVVLSDDAFVDVRTGRRTPMPRSLRSILGADHFRVSPNGRWLAFDQGGRVYLACSDGTRVRMLAIADTSHPTPSWSPDGRELVFGSGNAVIVMNVSTEETRKVLQGGARVYRPEFSPDGDTILFTRAARGAMNLWTVPVSGAGGATVLLRGAAFGTYSPDGRWIAFRRTAFDGSDVTELTKISVSAIRPDGTARRVLWKGDGWMSQIDEFALWPSWSPDGSRIAFEPWIDGGVFLLRVETGRSSRLGSGIRPSWLDEDTLFVEEAS